MVASPRERTDKIKGPIEATHWTQTPKQRLAILRHDWAIRDLVFTPDSQTLVSSAGDETVRFWQAVG
jgi:WD40 repeat protein